jgi:hypothetical protein
MKKPIGRFVTGVMALAMFGCHGPAAGMASGSSPAVDGGGEPAASAGTQTKFVTDPALNSMNAYSVIIPAKWQFQGVLLQGGQGKCNSLPDGVWRASSPDGLSFVEVMPTMSWIWGTGPMIGYTARDGCLPLKGPMSAQDFLKYLSAMMQVEYVADEPIPADENARLQATRQHADAAVAGRYAQMNIRAPKNTAEMARAIVRYRNGTFTMKGRLEAHVNCTEKFTPGMHSILRGMPSTPDSTVDQCSADVVYWTAPENQFAAMMKVWLAPGMGYHADPNWQNTYVLNVIHRTAAAQQANFEHEMAVQQTQHQQFLDQMQEGTDRSMARAAAIANSNHQMASDMVDYSLDHQTVMDPSTGQISKVSSTYSQTWIDSSGKTSFQTNNTSANPNGYLPGTWVKQTVTHGDGAPY